MKIVLCISSIWGGGAERVMSVLANHWAECGAAVMLVTFERSTRDYALDSRIERISLELNEVSTSLVDAVSNNWRRFFALRRVLRAARPSAVISFEDRMNCLVLLAAMGSGIRCIVSERTDPRRHRIDPIWAALRRLAYPLADALVLQTEALRGWGAQVSLDRSCVHVISNPLRFIRCSARSRPEPVCRTVVAMGRLIPAKGFDALLRAFAQVAGELPDWKIVIAGEGPERANLMALAESLGILRRLTLTDWVDEPADLLATADIFALPSRYEGFPNMLLEAMACGVAVIATASAGACEIVTDGVDGLLVPVDSPSELAQALRRLATDGVLRRRLGQRALAVSERYKVDAVIRKWDELITPPPRIIFLARDLDIGGAQRQMIDLAAGLHRSGWKVAIATFYAGGALEPDLGGTGVPLICLHKRGRWDVIGFLWRLMRLFRNERPQIAHGLLGVPNVLLAVLKPLLGYPRVVWGIAASDMDLNQYGWLMRLEFRVSILLSKCADLMISNSRAGLDYHAAHGYPRERIVVIPNGVDVERFRPDSEARGRLRAEWGVTPDKPLIGIVGRLDPMKDHPNFLRAAADVANARPEARFVCIGDGPPAHRLALQELASQLGLGGRLLWAGARHDIEAVYNALDVTVSSSISEGLPNAVVEAMASGVPCVVTDVGDSADVVDGLGWVCPSQDSAALAKAILQALDSLPRDAGLIRERIRAHFSADVRLERTAGELARLLEPGKAWLERA